MSQARAAASEDGDCYCHRDGGMAQEESIECCIFAPDAHVGDGFGFSLSSSSDASPGILAVGAPTSGPRVATTEDAEFHDLPDVPVMPMHWNDFVPTTGAGGAGAVMVYTTMGEETTSPCLVSHLRPPPAGTETEAARFGHCVSVSSRGGWLAVGAPHATRNGNRRSGAVLVYRSTDAGFVLDQEIISNYSLENDRFGWSCSIDELHGVLEFSAVLVCGCWASRRRVTGRGGGYIQIYHRHTSDDRIESFQWELIQTHDPEGNGLLYGFSVAVSGDYFAVGDPADNFEFKRNQGTLWGWVRNVKETAKATNDDNFFNEHTIVDKMSTTCAGCGMSPIVGVLWKCSSCPNYRLGGPGLHMCSECVDPETKLCVILEDHAKWPNIQKEYNHHQASHLFWNLDEEKDKASRQKFRKDDKTWYNAHGKTGGGMWGNSQSLLKVGSAVSQSNRYQAAGAPEWNDGVGVVFVRELSAVKNRERGMVLAPDTVERTVGRHRFGSALDVKWPLLAVGAPGHSNKEGAAYLFLYQGGAWTSLGTKMHLNQAGVGSMFGSAVSICGVCVFVGAPHASKSPGCVQYVHVSEKRKAAFSKEDQNILRQCRKSRIGESLSKQVYESALAKVSHEGAAPWPLAKIMMVGEGRAGKTALRNALVGNAFGPTDSTIGIETVNMGRMSIIGAGQGRWIEGLDSAAIEFDGCEGEMMERSIAKVCLQDLHKDSQAIVRVQPKPMSDLMRSRVKGASERWVHYTRKHKIADGTGSDMELHDTGSGDDSLAQPIQPSGNAAFLQAGAIRRVEEVMRSLDEERDEFSLELWDFGGQDVFYILYHLFLTEFGTYLLTFSMERLTPTAIASDKEQCLAMIQYWLDNIALHTGTGQENCNAPIALVGTHKDKVSDPRDHEAISKLLWTKFSSHVQWPFVLALKDGVVSTGRGLLWFYPVDNTRSTDHVQGGRDPVLGQLIHVLEAKIQSFDHLHRMVPFSWMRLYDKLQAELQTGKLVVSMERVNGLASECGIPLHDVRLALHYLDCNGMLLYCPNNLMHSESVVLDAVRFLVRGATIILCQHDIHHEGIHLQAAQDHSALWTELISNGVLDTALLSVLWKEFDAQDHNTLLILMHRYGLICPITTTETHLPSSRFLVPSLLRDEALSEPPIDAKTFCIAFSAGPIGELSDNDTITSSSLKNLFLPEGMFSRVVAKCVQWIQQTCRESTPLRSMSLKRREALLSFGRHRCLLQHSPAIHSFTVHILVQNTEVVIQRLEEIVTSVIEEDYPKLNSTILLPCDGALRPKQADNPNQSDLFLPLQSLRRAVEERKGLWLGETHASAIELSTRFTHFLPPKGLLPAYDVFISYRWTPLRGAFCNDSELATKLFDVMGSYAIGSRGRRPEVFLDRHRLEDGRRFDVDFMTAMAKSSVVIPLVSHDALQRMLTIQLDEPRPCDNVLLEWCLITELMEQEKLRCVLPIMIGPIEDGCVTSLFATGAKDKLPKVICHPEIEKVRDFVRRNGWKESDKLSKRTVHGVVDSICSCLGIMLWNLKASHGSPSGDVGHLGLYEAAAAQVMNSVEALSHMATLENPGDLPPEQQQEMQTNEIGWTSPRNDHLVADVRSTCCSVS